MRFTKIIATIGPATCTVPRITELADFGVNICRLNFSHGDHTVHGQTMDNVKEVNRTGRSLAIMLDTKGPEVRSGDVKEPIMVKKGEKYMFTSQPTGKETMTTIKVDYDKFSDDVKNATSILIDNGAIEFIVEKIEKNGTVIAKALEDGKIGSRRHINLPGAHISLPSFTKKDWSDIEFGVKKGVDFYALSFVRTGEDVQEIKKYLTKHKSEAEIISKIETPEAVSNIDAIIDASDAIMVARGDLGAEVPFEEVPKIQELIVAKCRAKNKPVIVATHMLESMIQSPMPTRAEVTDIAFAAKLQTDATMLSGETTTGLYPYKAVSAMDRVLRRNEHIQPKYEQVWDSSEMVMDINMPRREQALAACVLATKLQADAIIVISKHGNTAKSVSNRRPMIPIHAFVGSESTQRKMQLVWGVSAHVIKFSDKTEVTLDAALALLSKEKIMKKKQRIVVVSDMTTKETRVMTIQIRTI